MPIPNTSPNLFGWWQQLDKKLGGVLPGGGTPVSMQFSKLLKKALYTLDKNVPFVLIKKNIEPLFLILFQPP
jgi:hypothetical protein